MYRTAVIAVLAGTLVPAMQAQRGFARPGGARPAAPAPARMGAPMRTAPGFRGNVVVGGGFGFRDGRWFHHRHGFFSGGCLGGRSCRGAFFNPWIAGPVFWPAYDYGYASYAPAYAAPTYDAPAYDDTGLRLVIQQLTDEVEELRREEQERAHPAAAPEPTGRLAPAAVFLIKDGTRVETRNYGLAGQTLWLLNERHARMVPLSQVDIDATNKLNQERGIDLVLPTPR